MNKNTYVSRFFEFTDKIVKKKRNEIFLRIKESINLQNINSILDVGTTNDDLLKSSNMIIYQFKDIKIKKSISDQKINNNFFDLNFTKSITEKLTKHEKDILLSDMVISSATIEHVGNDYNKKMMIYNMSKLSKKYFVFTTPNRFYPIDFHTKLPLIHFLPKKIHRYILKLLGMNFFSEEKNLDLISYNQLNFLLKQVDNFKIEIKKIKLFGLTSNFLVIAKKNEL